MIITITAACSDSLITQANHLAMCLAFSEADGRTYRAPTWQNSTADLFSCASFTAGPSWIGGAQSALVRPSWDTSEIIDMELAAEAQAAMVFWTPEFGGEPPQATQGVLTVIGGMDGLAALSAMGMTRAEGDV